MSEQIIKFWKLVIKGFENGLLRVFFSVAQYILYFVAIVTATIVMEVVSTVEPTFFVFTNMIGAFAAMITLLVAVLIHLPIGIFMSTAFNNDESQLRAMAIIRASGYSFIGHFFATMVEVILAPIFVMLNIINVTAEFILVSSATRELDTGKIVPTSCAPHSVDRGTVLLPLYTVGDIQLIGPFLNALTSGLDYKIKLCTADIIGETLGSRNDLYCASVRPRDLPGLSQTWTALNSIKNAELFPSEIFLFIFDAIEDFFQFLFPELSGTDLLKHYIFVDRLEFTESNALASGQGSDPFDGFLTSKLETVFGCDLLEEPVTV